MKSGYLVSVLVVCIVCVHDSTLAQPPAAWTEPEVKEFLDGHIDTWCHGDDAWKDLTDDAKIDWNGQKISGREGLKAAEEEFKKMNFSCTDTHEYESVTIDGMKAEAVLSDTRYDEAEGDTGEIPNQEVSGDIEQEQQIDQKTAHLKMTFGVIKNPQGKKQVSSLTVVVESVE